MEKTSNGRSLPPGSRRGHPQGHPPRHRVHLRHLHVLRHADRVRLREEGERRQGGVHLLGPDKPEPG